MSWFIWFIVVLLAVECAGKAVILYRQDVRRNLALLPFDILISIAVIGWGVWLLARSS